MTLRCELPSMGRVPAACGALLLCWLTLAVTAAAAGPAPGDREPLTRQQLIGAWRLVRIDYAGPNGPLVDPFYQPGSEGFIVYDASGWMSCQIGAPRRSATANRRPDARRDDARRDDARRSAVPQSRLRPPATTAQARDKAAAYDTYYAYYGTWEFDPATSVVTHHVEASLIPAETGLDYAQMATLEDGRLIFRVRDATPGHETLRTKVWERVRGPRDP